MLTSITSSPFFILSNLNEEFEKLIRINDDFIVLSHKMKFLKLWLLLIITWGNKDYLHCIFNIRYKGRKICVPSKTQSYCTQRLSEKQSQMKLKVVRFAQNVTQLYKAKCSCFVTYSSDNVGCRIALFVWLCGCKK